MTEEQKGAMFDEFLDTGLLDDANVILRTNRFASWDYKGQVSPAVLALRCEMLDEEQKVHEQYMSSGDMAFFVPSNDGKKAVPIGKYQKLNKNTNAAAFILSIMNADVRGEMTAKLKATDDISILDGLRVHVVRKKQPKRPGLVAPGSEAASAQEQAKEQFQLVVDKVLSYPWENGAGQPMAAGSNAPAPSTVSGASVAAQAAPAQATNAGAAGDLAIGVLVSVIGANGGTIKKAVIAGKVYTNDLVKSESAATKNAILGLVTKDEFLLSEQVKAVGIIYNQQTGDVTLG